ncbi:MAG: hypothetical protein HQK54_11980 [Oligoflexales bacterium]|nr:hypothetical protein [Oligoflexales bacterium]
MESPIFTFAVLIVFSIIVYHIYFYAQELKLQRKGSDFDDCILRGARLMTSGFSPYKEKSYLGNPCSPGPIVHMIHLPFIKLGIFQLATAFWLFVTTITLRVMERNWIFPNIFLLILCSSPIFWGISVIGCDYVTFSCILLLSVLSLKQCVIKQNHESIIITAVLCGIMAGTRVNFLYLPFAFAFALFFYHRKAIPMFLLISCLIAFLPGAYFYFLDPNSFTPFHVLTRGHQALSPVPMIITLVINIALFILGTCKFRKNVDNILLFFLFIVAPSLIFLSIGSLFWVKLNIIEWEGANYFVPIYPMLAAIYAKTILDDKFSLFGLEKTPEAAADPKLIRVKSMPA